MPQPFPDAPLVTLMPPDWSGRCVFIGDDQRPASPLCTNFPDTLAAVKKLHEAVLRFRREPTKTRAQQAQRCWYDAKRAVSTLPVDRRSAMWLDGLGSIPENASAAHGPTRCPVTPMRSTSRSRWRASAGAVYVAHNGSCTTAYSKPV